jgi:hypothetical protein
MPKAASQAKICQKRGENAEIKGGCGDLQGKKYALPRVWKGV